MSKIPKSAVEDEIVESDIWYEATILEDLNNEFDYENARSWKWYLTLEERTAEGWTFVQVSKDIDNYHAIDIRKWLMDNDITEFLNEGDEFLFKRSEDAVLFTLRCA